MTEKLKSEIEKISKEFASGFKDTIGEISRSGYLIVDPLSAYLNMCGYKNKLYEIPAKENNPHIIIIQFEDGTQFVPAGSDLPFNSAKDWMWINATLRQ